MNPGRGSRPPRRTRWPWSLVVGWLALGPVAGQSPAPRAEAAGGDVRHLSVVGRDLLEREDVVGALRAFRQLRARAPGHPAGLLGLGEVHLKMAAPELAVAYAEAALEVAPGDQRAAALLVRALLRQRRFARAVEESARLLDAASPAGAELWAARASALFRVQRIAESAAAYEEVLRHDPLHAEAHIRLGSGLSPLTAEGVLPDGLAAGVAALRARDFDGAVGLFRAVLDEHLGHAVVHRLLGEALLRRKAEATVAVDSPEFRALAAALPVPEVSGLWVAKFMPAYADLDPVRQRVAARAMGTFAAAMPRLVAMGGRHDLLAELERTTADPARAMLRGKHTFDGRLWDDVRGIGGLRAATGIESLDDVLLFGFDTLVHEIAHQAHLYAFPRSQRLRITELYEVAMRDDLCLDYYAANNEAEYFGQGVEAFCSYGKRPGREATHGHTRFELFRKDRALHDFIAGVVSFDPLSQPEDRRRILPAAIRVALRTGRVDDAVVAAEMMDQGPERERWVAEAQRARLFARSY